MHHHVIYFYNILFNLIPEIFYTSDLLCERRVATIEVIYKWYENDHVFFDFQ